MIECAVKGMINPGAMCGAVIVGNKSCGFKGECEHQRKPDHSGEATKKVERDCGGAQHHRYAGRFGD